jgi:16S rRNA (cytidine1402-2'-O)-methyltransferase
MPPGARESKGTLFVVATPIGNLEDITLRALRVLKTVQLVAAEDTRRTGNLLRHFGIDTPILSVHEHNERARIQRIAVLLGRGESVALVTDAGTPAVSDPGAGLVAAIREAGFRIEPIPGPSAVSAAISAAGVSSAGFTFLGFPPIRSKDRKLWFEALQRAASERAVVFFEAPHKVQKTLKELGLLVNRPIFAARELTKAHEELALALPNDLILLFANPQGEFTFVIPPAIGPATPIEVPPDTEIAALVGQITETIKPKSLKEASRLAGERLGLSARLVYAAVERTKIGR